MISAVIRFKDDKVSIHSAQTDYVGKKFEKGFYKVFIDDKGNFHISKEKINELHEPYQNREINNCLDIVDKFFEEGIKEKINSLGFTHKLGILLHGKQGCGKTTFLNYVANSLIDKLEAVVFFCNDEDTLNAALSLSSSVREIQDNPIVFIADEFERYADRAESEMKNFLDGIESVNNSLFLAATNYLDRVPDTLKDRPSRFKIVQELKGIENKDAMRNIVREMSKKIKPNLFSEQKINDLVKDLKNVTLDELKQIILDEVTGSHLPEQPKRSVIGFKKEEKIEDEEEIIENKPAGITRKHIREAAERVFSARPENPEEHNKNSNV